MPKRSQSIPSSDYFLSEDVKENMGDRKRVRSGKPQKRGAHSEALFDSSQVSLSLSKLEPETEEHSQVTSTGSRSSTSDRVLRSRGTLSVSTSRSIKTEEFYGEEPKLKETNDSKEVKTIKLNDWTEDKEAIMPKEEVADSSHQMLIGGHVSIAGGVYNAVANAQKDGARAFAMFLKSQRQWQAKPLTQQDADRFKQACVAASYTPDRIVPHGSYLINLGSPDDRKLHQSREAYVDELLRCEMLGLTLHNVHPGSSCGQLSTEQCLQRVAHSINLAHAQTTSCITLLENMSGQGHTVGGTFEELRKIIDGVTDTSRVGVCLDTCHLFAAGYDIRSEDVYEKTMKDFDDIIGFQYLKAVHLNDSKGALGCHLDRHERIGQGQIGRAAFRRLLHDERFRGLPLVLETPTNNKQGYASEIRVLETLLQD